MLSSILCELMKNLTRTALLLFQFLTLFPHRSSRRLRNLLCSNNLGIRFIFEYKNKVADSLEERFSKAKSSMIVSAIPVMSI